MAKLLVNKFVVLIHGTEAGSKEEEVKLFAVSSFLFLARVRLLGLGGCLAAVL